VEKYGKRREKEGERKGKRGERMRGEPGMVKGKQKRS